MLERELRNIVHALAEGAAAAGARQVLLVCGDESWCAETAEPLTELYPDAVLVAERSLAGLQPSERRRLLGIETACLLVDLWSRPGVNTIAAAVGSLRQGGLLVLLAPAPEQWPDYLSDDEEEPSRFWQRWIDCLRDDDYVAWLDRREGYLPPRRRLPPSGTDTELPTSDQCQALALIRRVLHGHRRRPLVLRADRGRGKSALLGLAAAEILQENAGDVLLTAPRREAVLPTFGHARQALGCDPDESVAYGDHQLRFFAPDRLLRERPSGRILLVDEAAAIPPALLAAMVRHYSRVVFATTVHGYEGSGRGFDSRFAEALDALTPQWRRFELNEAIRWGDNDPVEPLFNRLLLLDADIPARAHADGVSVSRVDRDALVEDEALLGELFGLLVIAHYQTTPADLQQLLDSEAIQLWMAANDSGQVLGAALVIIEGGLDDIAESGLDDTAEEESLLDVVQRGERRLRGHLLPQSLAYHAGRDWGLRLRCARISRIAVRPDLRRRGIGAALLGAVEVAAAEAGFDYVGSSFAADTEVCAFWLAADYLPLRLGVRRDPCSGGHALMVGKGLSAEGVESLEDVYRQFSADFLLQLREPLADLEWPLSLMLLNAAAPSTETAVPGEVLRYVSGELPFEHAYPGLYRFVLAARGRALTHADEIGIVLQKLLQGRSWRDLADAFGATGREQVEHGLRRGLRMMMGENRGEYLQ